MMMIVYVFEKLMTSGSTNNISVMNSLTVQLCNLVKQHVTTSPHHQLFQQYLCKVFTPLLPISYTLISFFLINKPMNIRMMG